MSLASVTGDFLCDPCRQFDIQRLLLSPELQGFNYLRTELNDIIEIYRWNLATTRQSHHCPLCRFLLSVVSHSALFDHPQTHTIGVWPQPIASHSIQDRPNIFLGLLSLCGLREFPKSPTRSRTGWQLRIGLNIPLTEPINYDTEYDTAGARPRRARILTDPPETAAPVHLMANFPDGPPSNPGFQPKGRSSDPTKLPYPTSDRGLNHMPGPAEHFFRLRVDDLEPLCTSILPQGQHPTGLYNRMSISYEEENIMKSRSVNPHRADFPLARHWLGVCAWHHDGWCNPMQWTNSPSSSFTLKVIDLRRWCIVKAPKNCQYVALSYTWGTVTQLQATKAEPFTRHLSLAKEKDRIPKTVLDAMYACVDLRIRYLWVDRLCITQDCELDQKAQIKHMGYIYGGAKLTIVAGQGKDANAGLAGVSDVARREEVYRKVQIHDIELQTSPADPFQTLLKSPWYSRGWTFQELVLSKRLLVFTEEQMLFICVKSTFREDRILGNWNGFLTRDPASSQLPKHMSFATHKFGPENFLGEHNEWLQQGLASYQSFLAHYLLRTLGNESDILNAFNGISTALSPYIGSFRWGIPIVQPTLLFEWHTRDQFPLRRRVCAPSWSWAGWKGYSCDIDFGNAIRLPKSYSLLYLAPARLVLFALTDRCTLIPLDPLMQLPTRPPQIDDQVKAQLKPPYNRYIVFTADCATLSVDRQVSYAETYDAASRTSLEGTYAIRWPSDDRMARFLRDDVVGRLSLDPVWRESQRDWMEFILIPSQEKDSFGTIDTYTIMLITRDGPVSSRIQISEKGVSRFDFERLSTRRELIILC